VSHLLHARNALKKVSAPQALEARWQGVPSVESNTLLILTIISITRQLASSAHGCQRLQYASRPWVPTVRIHTRCLHIPGRLIPPPFTNPSVSLFATLTLPHPFVFCCCTKLSAVQLPLREFRRVRRADDVQRLPRRGRGASRRCRGASRQRLTLVHFSAQRKRFLWERGCMCGLIRGCLRGIRGY